MKVGDYVRTKDGIILKVKDIEDIYTTNNEYIGMAIYDKDGHFVNDVEIIKSSPEIINLIKEGDLVNNHIVGQISYENQTIDNIKYLDLEGVNILVCNDEIKSIVTKECFESMEYKVGELDER